MQLHSQRDVGNEKTHRKSEQGYNPIEPHSQARAWEREKFKNMANCNIFNKNKFFLIKFKKLMKGAD